MKKTLQLALEDHVCSLEQLQLENEIISMEAFAGMASLKQAISRLPNFFTSAKNLISNKISAFFKTRKQLFSYSDLCKTAAKVEQKSYADLQDVRVYVPEGLNADLLSYTRALKKVGETVILIETDVLKPYETYLAQIVGDPARLSAVSGKLDIQQMRRLDLTASEKQIQSMFVASGQRTPFVKYSQAIHRNGDIKLLAEELDSLERLFGEDSHKRLMAHSERLNVLLSDLVNMIELNETKISPNYVKSLGDTTYHVARLLEQYGLFRYRLIELSYSLDETAKILNKV